MKIEHSQRVVGKLVQLLAEYRYTIAAHINPDDDCVDQTKAQMEESIRKAVTKDMLGEDFLDMLQHVKSSIAMRSSRLDVMAKIDEIIARVLGES